MLLALFFLAASLEAADPVFDTGVAAPTKDKPQSKLWFAQGTWWAWMPQPAGSSLYRRTASGWQRSGDLEGVLRILPRQADVWAEGGEVAAVLVESRRVAFVRARFEAGHYVLAGKPAVFPMPGNGTTETATLARDGNRRWWIAYNHARHMWVRPSLDETGETWHEPIAVSEQPAAEDDICAISAMPGGVGVIWSDQAHDTVLFRFHPSRQAVTQWNPPEIVAQGHHTADDHFHTALAPDGTLFAATKSSLDTIGQPQLVLRVRHPRGRWTNHPYAMRTAAIEPSRPIVLLGAGRLYLLHSIYVRDRTKVGYVAMQSTPAGKLELSGEAAPLLEARFGTNNVTGSKAALPPGAPWIVLASDDKGNVYEADIRPH